MHGADERRVEGGHLLFPRGSNDNLHGRMTMKTRRLKRALLACTAVAAVTAPGPTAAQTATAQRSVGIEEIVVTARKREESLLDIPLTVTAFSAAEIEASAMNSIRDLARLTPAFTFPDVGARYLDGPVIRGIAGNDADATKQSSSFFVDGIYVSGSIQGIDMSEIERIEVIKGPQSALFGRATFAGAINFITKDPSNEPEGRIFLMGAEHDEFEANASYGGPLVADRLFMRLNARYWTYGGEWRSSGIPAGIKLGGQSTWNVGGSLVFTPSDRLRVKWRLNYSRDDDGPEAVNKKIESDQNCRFNAPTICGEVAFDPNRVGATYDELIAEGWDLGIDRKTWRTSLAVDYEFDGVTASLLAGYNNEKMLRPWDVVSDQVKNPIFIGFGGAGAGKWGGQIVNDFRFKDWSAELRLASNGDGPLQWIIGGYAADFKQAFGRVRGAVTVDPPNRRTVDNLAGFAQVSYDITSRFNVSAEGRYQREKLARRNFNTNEVLTLASGVVAEETFTTFLPRVTAQFEATDDLTFYALWAKGNKPGDFNTGATVRPEFVVIDEEKIEAIEGGVKFNGFDDRLAVTLAVFTQKLSNQQVRDITPQFQFLTRNSGKYRSRGFEIDATVAPFEGFTLRGAFAMADAEYTQFANSADMQLIFGNGNAVGQVPRSVPKYTGSLTATYTQPVTDTLEAYIRGDLTYRSKIYADDTNLSWAGTLVQVNLRLGVEAQQWKLELFGRNLFDDDTPQRIGFNTDFRFFPARSPRVVSLVPSRGRQFGVSATYTF
jgi:iron complex outermembrane receptor protein